MNFEIRPASEADFPKIIEMFREFAKFEKQEHMMTNSLDKMLNEKDYFHCFVAQTSNNELAGYVTYFFAYYTWIGKSLYMDDLYVRKKFRAQGIGSALIKSIINHAKKSECHKIRWQVSKWNKPAKDFYRKLGADIIDEQNDCHLTL